MANRWEAMGALLDRLPFVVLSVDLEANVLSINRMGARNLSHTPDEVEGKSLFDYFPEGAAVAARQRIHQTVEAREIQHFESVVTLPDGSERSYSSVYYPTIDDNGDVTSVEIVSMDTTAARPPAEPRSDLWSLTSDDLSMTNTRVATLLENAPLVVSVYDPDMTIRYMNRVAPGVKLADVIGKTPLPWTAEESRTALREAFEHVRDSGEVAECEVTGISGAHWLVRLAPLVHDGEVRQIVGCTLDITELKRLQAQLVQRQKTESLGILARGVAHDFNNLLTAIMTYAGMIRRRASNELDVCSMLDEIDSASQRAADLCQQMLVYSGGNRPSDSPAELNAVLEEIAPLTRAGVASKIQLTFNLAEKLPMIRCGAPQLGQVVLNLINNAADAIGDERGTIVVSTDSVVLSGADGDLAGSSGAQPENDSSSDGGRAAEHYLPGAPSPGTYVRLRVSDTGCGLSDEARRLIFDPFYSTKTTGHGLGLSVVLGILAAHGAAIRVESAQGRGTTMTLLFPAVDNASVGAAAKSNATTWPVGSGVVLVVDDVDAVRRSAALVLGEAGYDVVEADSGDAALEVIARSASPILAVVLDVTMPGRDGYETLDELRRTHPRLPVLLSSGKPLESRPDDPFVHLLPKPYTPDVIVRSVARALAND